MPNRLFDCVDRAEFKHNYITERSLHCKLAHCFRQKNINNNVFLDRRNAILTSMRKNYCWIFKKIYKSLYFLKQYFSPKFMSDNIAQCPKSSPVREKFRFLFNRKRIYKSYLWHTLIAILGTGLMLFARRGKAFMQFQMSYLKRIKFANCFHRQLRFSSANVPKICRSKSNSFSFKIRKNYCEVFIFEKIRQKGSSG